MARRLSDWLLTNPVLVSPGYPYDVALLYGAQWDNAVMDERLVENFEEFRRRYAFPRIVAGRAEDFFRDVERRFRAEAPGRPGDTGPYLGGGGGPAPGGGGAPPGGAARAAGPRPPHARGRAA